MKKLTVKIGFIILMFLIASIYSTNRIEFVSWLGVVFVSVLFHELGHSLTAAAFGKSSLIELSFFGGTTYFRQEGLKKWQLFLISLNGPVFGFGLFFLSSFLATQIDPSSKFMYALKISSFVNLFWTVLNLLPILPLDGGQLLRIFLEGVFKNRGLFFAGVLSCIFATTLALIAFLMANFLVGAILFLFAFQNFELVKQARYLSLSDQEESFRKKLQEAVVLFESGQFEQVEPLLKTLIAETKQGMIFHQALAMQVIIMRMKKDYKSIYESLRPYPKLFESDLSAIMHEASFFQNDMPMVKKLALEAFQKESTIDTAFHSAVAAALLKDDEAAIGWLKTAQELGFNIDEIKAHPVLKAYAEKLS